jgi:hypothetical protein
MSDELRRTLEGAGRQDAPPPDPAFVRDLEARLAGGAVLAIPRRRPLLPAAAAVVGMAAAIGLAIGLTQHDSPSDQVRTEPNPSVTTSTLLGPTTTSTTVVVAPPVTTPSTTSTTARPSSTPTTTTAPRPTTTTSTTAPPPAPQDLHLACTTDATTTTISCRWDASTNPAFASFRLTRRTHDGPENIVYTGTGREFSERSGTGARWVYLVTALDAAGNPLGSSTVDTTCC